MKTVLLIAVLAAFAPAAVIGEQVELAKTWPDKHLTYLEDKVARKKHDLVTIVVKESAKADVSAETEVERTGEHKFAFKKMVEFMRLADVVKDALIDKRGSNSTIQRKDTPNVFGSEYPEIDYSFSKKFEGDGELKKDHSLDTKITGIIIEVLPNGTMTFEAKKVLVIGEEETTVTLTGTFRGVDVNSSNEIESGKIANAKITYKGDGIVSDANKRSWIQKFFDFINIF